MNNLLSSHPVYLPCSMSCRIFEDESSMSLRWIRPRK